MGEIHPLVQKIFHIQEIALEHEAKVTKMKSAIKPATMIYLCKFGENPSTRLKDIPLTSRHDLENEIKVTKH